MKNPEKDLKLLDFIWKYSTVQQKERWNEAFFISQEVKKFGNNMNNYRAIAMFLNISVSKVKKVVFKLNL